MKSNPNTNLLFASGSNDNSLIIYDLRIDYPFIKKNAHKAAVRALSWDLNRWNFLFSGGGTDDKYLRSWNVNDLSIEKQIYLGC